MSLPQRLFALPLMVCGLLFGSVSPAAKSQVIPLTDGCINKLAAGNNWYGVQVNREALKKIQRGIIKLQRETNNKERVLLVDYSLNSRQKRSFLVNLVKCDLDAHDYVIHGGWGRPDKKGRVSFKGGDSNHDGNLDRCLRPNGSREFMTRPGLAITGGLRTSKGKFPKIQDNFTAISLIGKEPHRNDDMKKKGVILHEHKLISENGAVKPVGQGCPAYPQGVLRNMLRYGIANKMLVYLHAPQCGG